jgi:hypothetical protein
MGESDGHPVTVRKVLLIPLTAFAAVSSVAQIGGAPGAYSRMGFGARGMGMGNALTAVVSGDVIGYYNPAVIPLAEYRNVSGSFGLLSLDRSLNFLGFTQTLPPDAGVSAGLINAGVSNIDGRDADGEQTGMLKTSENQLFLGFGLKFRSGFSFGVNLKILYYHLYTDFTSLTAGLDFGVIYRFDNALTLGLTVKDVNSKYKWDSTPLYAEQGTSLQENFPLRATIGAAYMLPDSVGLISADVEFSDVRTRVLRVGAEIPVIREVTLRAGVDRIDLKEKGTGASPAFGFTIARGLEGWTPSITYVYVIEPFAPTGLHMISLGVIF